MHVCRSGPRFFKVLTSSSRFMLHSFAPVQLRADPLAYLPAYLLVTCLNLSVCTFPVSQACCRIQTASWDEAMRGPRRADQLQRGR